MNSQNLGTSIVREALHKKIFAFGGVIPQHQTPPSPSPLPPFQGPLFQNQFFFFYNFKEN